MRCVQDSKLRAGAGEDRLASLSVGFGGQVPRDSYLGSTSVSVKTALQLVRPRPAALMLFGSPFAPLLSLGLCATVPQPSLKAGSHRRLV